MSTSEAAQLSDAIRLKVAEINKLFEGMDEKTASSAPEGRWSPKQIISHLCGPEDSGHMPILEAFLQQETPTIDLDAGNPFFSGKRSAMTVNELLAEFEREYEKIARFAAGLSPEQLNRKAHIPFLKETPLGEYPTLSTWLKALGERHVGSHIDHLKEILQELGAAQ